ncbi:hypothetical protein DN752_10510 [Echinicola strongylocentroti]|uniref:Uncharacterized protein n=1 Tax=Echinicola strongylocentroti TaxID=1795355 RepID=A0A2Z4IHC6_9BACT|nr:hypothetical protein [Echinicola strongylocentroti]AWW30522.1 hypothetical protein DN752_10510 [Echinicola strongylocentroti]
MNELLKRCEGMKPGIVFEWNDSEPEDVSRAVLNALKKICDLHSQKTGIAKKSFEIALRQLV